MGVDASTKLQLSCDANGDVVVSRGPTVVTFRADGAVVVSTPGRLQLAGATLDRLQDVTVADLASLLAALDHS